MRSSGWIDYRDVAGRFDRIVSVGMFEHVGVGFYDTYFRRCAQLLDNDGVFCCIRSAAAARRASPIPGSQNTSFPAATSLPSRRSYLPSSAHSLSSPTLKYCNSTTPKRSRPGATAFLHTAKTWTAVRSAVRPHVGVLSRILGNGVSRERHGRVPDPDDQAERHRAGDARLYRARGSAAAVARSRLFRAAAARRRIVRNVGQEKDVKTSSAICVCRRRRRHTVCSGESRNERFPSGLRSIIDKVLVVCKCSGRDFEKQPPSLSDPRC